MGGTLPPTRDGHGGEPLPPKTPPHSGGEQSRYGGEQGGSHQKCQFRAFGGAPPHSGGDFWPILVDFRVLPPTVGGTLVHLGGSRGDFC